MEDPPKSNHVPKCFLDTPML